MGVQLNIKNAEARTLAEQLARATGDSITEAVTQALRIRLRQVERDMSVTEDERRKREVEFYHMIAGSRGRWKGAMLSIDHADILYDEDGLPR